jgi:hypothetical protein
MSQFDDSDDEIFRTPPSSPSLTTVAMGDWLPDDAQLFVVPELSEIPPNSAPVPFNDAARVKFDEWLAANPPRAAVSDDVYRQRCDVLQGRVPDGLSSKFRWKTRKFYSFEDGKLRTDNKEVVPTTRIFDTIVRIHDVLIHSGIGKTASYIAKHYYGISKQCVAKLLHECNTCALYQRNMTTAPLEPIPSTAFMERVQMDLIDMSKQPDREYKWILHIKDHFSKFSQLYALKTKETAGVGKGFMSWIGTFGPPKILQTDNGREFCSNLIETIAKDYGIKIIHSRPRHPQTQGLVEQGNGTVENRLSKWMQQRKRIDWASALPHIALSINATRHEAIKVTPYEVAFNRKYVFHFAEDTITEKESTELVGNSNALGENNAAPGEDDAAPGEDDAAPGEDDAALGEDDAAPGEDDAAPGEDDAALGEDAIEARAAEASRLHAQVLQNLELSRERMVRKHSKGNKRIRSFSIGDKVSVAVSRKDRHPTDNKRLPCIVVKVSHGNRYQLLCEFGILDRYSTADELNDLPDTFPLTFTMTGNWQQAATITLHEAANRLSTIEAVPVSCRCKSSCNDNRCKCKKAKVNCTNRCHSRRMCNNFAGQGRR